MENKKKLVGIGVAVLACAAVGVTFFMRRAPAPAPEPVVQAPVPPPPLPPPAAPKAPEVIHPPQPANLEQSDEMLQARAKDLSSFPLLSQWLKTGDMVRRTVAAVDVIAQGKSPRQSLGFLSPKKKFLTKKKGDKLYLDPRGYARYDAVAEGFQSLNTQATVKLIQEWAPLFKAASQELDTPRRDFTQNLVQAINELLKTPIVERPIPLREKVISCAIEPEEDANFEELSAAQKHLLRMGPKNTAKIQSKLREFARGLGVTEDQLPRPVIYSAK